MTPEPTSVPHFPVYTLALSPQGQSITLNGMPVIAREGEDLQGAGHRAVVELMRSNNLPSVRVAVIDKDSASKWEMAMWDTGESVDLTAIEENRAQRAQRRQRLKRNLVIGAVTVAVLAVSGTVAGVVLNRTAPVVSAYEPEGAGATVPAAAAPSFSSTATWTAPVATDSSTKLLDGLVLTAGTDDSLQGHNPLTGQVIWSAAQAPAQITSIHLSNYNGQSVLVAADQSALTFWPRTLDPGQSQATPFVVEMSYNDTAHLDSPQPYISQGDWYIRVPKDTGMESVMIPPGSLTALVREDGTILTVSADTLYMLGSEGVVSDSKPFAPPKGASGMPTQSRVLTPQKVLLSWEETDVMAILDTVSGTLTPVDMAETSLPREDEETLLDPDSEIAVIGTIIVNFGTSPTARELPISFTPTAVHRGVVYGSTNDGPGTFTTGQSDPEPKLWPAYTDADPAPVIVTDDSIYLVATQLEKSKIYRLDRKP